MVHTGIICPKCKKSYLFQGQLLVGGKIVMYCSDTDNCDYRTSRRDKNL